ncbi:MAG TPA: hypothetical protein VF535_08155 [Allosphingosinicella sp.]
MRLLPILLLAAACAAGSAREADLSGELAGRSAGPPEACVGSAANLAARDSRTLVTRDGDTIWVNRLAAPCPGLHPVSLLVVEPNDGSRYCRGDRFRAAEPTGGIPGPYCVLGSFTPYRR